VLKISAGVSKLSSKEPILSKRRQFVLDERTNQLLEELAADRAGNLSYVVREAIQLYAHMENRLDEIESDPEFQHMMEKSAAEIRAGRVTSQSQVKKLSRSKKRRG
jgi:predicted transcriptional regulator